MKLFGKLSITLIIYPSDSSPKSRSRLKTIYDGLINSSCSDLSCELIDTTYLFGGINKYSTGEIISHISKSDIVILDVIEAPALAKFELGVASALNIPMIMVASENLDMDISNIGSKYNVVFPNDITQIESDNNIQIAVKSQLEQILGNYYFKSRLFYKLWFPTETQNILIVVSPEPEKPQDANLLSHNYGFMDNVGDKDAILEIVKLLSKHYPTACLSICSSDKFNPADIKNNIVVIGGPGGPDYQNLDGSKIDDSGNGICKKMNEKFSSKISYTSDCEQMRVEDESYSAKYDNNGVMVEDFGYFAAMTNPFNPKTRVVLIHGIHTLGVVGSARAFSDEISAETNYQILFEKLSMTAKNDMCFESYFNVDVFNGEAFCPTINAKDIYLISSKSVIQSSKPPEIEAITEKQQESLQLAERLKYQLEMLWKDLLKEVPGYKDEAPHDYEIFTAAEVELSSMLDELKKPVSSQRHEEISRRYEEIHMEWRRRTR